MQNPRERILSVAHPRVAERDTRESNRENGEDATGPQLSEPPRTEALTAAFVVQQERQWTIAVIEAAARSRGTDAESRLLAAFDVLEEAFQGEEDESTPFLEVLLELGQDAWEGRPDVAHLAHIRDAIARMATEAGLREPEAFALSFHVLLKGCILSALEGDTLAGVRARELGRELIARHRTPRDLSGEAAAVPGATWFGDPSFELYEGENLQGYAPSGLLDWYDEDQFQDQPRG